MLRAEFGHLHITKRTAHLADDQFFWQGRREVQLGKESACSLARWQRAVRLFSEPVWGSISNPHTKKTQSTFIYRLSLFGRGGGNRTPECGFGDHRFTSSLRPYNGLIVKS